MKRLLFGTNNAHKLSEIRSIVGNRYQVLSLQDLGEPIDVAETEPTLEGNAILKAKAFFAHSQVPCFADDTGLEVAALDGAPGVYSARYAGEAASYQDNVRKLLQALEGKTARAARFRTVIAYFDGTRVETFEGAVDGLITEFQRGSHGFGYDPVFQPQGQTLTFAEMEPTVKNMHSHRARAVQQFADFLMSLS